MITPEMRLTSRADARIWAAEILAGSDPEPTPAELAILTNWLWAVGADQRWEDHPVTVLEQHDVRRLIDALDPATEDGQR